MRLIVVAALLVAGCASTGDLYRSPADDTVLSKKPIAEITRCLEVVYQSPFIEGPNGEKQIRIKNGYGGTIGLIVLKPEGQGTRVDFRRANGMVGKGPWQACTQSSPPPAPS